MFLFTCTLWIKHTHTVATLLFIRLRTHINAVCGIVVCSSCPVFLYHACSYVYIKDDMMFYSVICVSLRRIPVVTQWLSWWMKTSAGKSPLIKRERSLLGPAWLSVCLIQMVRLVLYVFFYYVKFSFGCLSGLLRCVLCTQSIPSLIWHSFLQMVTIWWRL